MSRFAFDQLSRGRSVVHLAPSGLKLALALGLLLFVVAWRGKAIWLWSIPPILLAVVFAARLSLRAILLRLLLLEPFILGVALLALTGPGGWRAALLLMARCTLCLAIMLTLAATTPFWRLMGVLRALHVPTLLVTVMSLMYRYLFLLVDEAHRLRRARASRAFRPVTRWEHWRASASTIGHLFIRTSDRAERVYDAMRARGWS